MNRRLIRLLAGLALCAPPVSAQSAPMTVGIDHSVYAGWPSSSVNWMRLSRVSLEMSWGRPLSSAWTLEYAPTVYPLALARGVFRSDRRVPGGRQGSEIGLGLHPFAGRIVRHLGSAGAYVGAAGGLMYFTGPIPTAAGTMGNFSLDVEVGVRVPITRRRMLVVSYHVNHLSNGGRGDLNLGVDSHLVRLALRPRR